ncbi:hypothetical protein AB0P17_34900, partial [Streptomyces sp. NPDC088124]
MDAPAFRQGRKRAPAERGNELRSAARADRSTPTRRFDVKSRKSAEYTTSGFRFREGKLTLAKMSGPLDIV